MSLGLVQRIVPAVAPAASAVGCRRLIADSPLAAGAIARPFPQIKSIHIAPLRGVNKMHSIRTSLFWESSYANAI